MADSIKKILEKKFWYAACIILCVAAAYAYMKTVTPQYRVSTTLMIDDSGFILTERFPTIETKI